MSNVERWRSVIAQLFSITFDEVYPLVAPVVCHSSPEGYLPSEEDDKDETKGKLWFMVDHVKLVLTLCVLPVLSLLLVRIGSPTHLLIQCAATSTTVNKFFTLSFLWSAPGLLQIEGSTKYIIFTIDVYIHAYTCMYIRNYVYMDV